MPRRMLNRIVVVDVEAKCVEADNLHLSSTGARLKERWF